MTSLERESQSTGPLSDRNGRQAGDRVGLLFSRSVWAYVAMLAVMKAGAAYVPLDPGFPKDRIAYIAETPASGSSDHGRPSRAP
jgi:non-ribosomal peptide synthetase component F